MFGENNATQALRDCRAIANRIERIAGPDEFGTLDELVAERDERALLRILRQCEEVLEDAGYDTED